MQLTKHFNLSELCVSDSAARAGIPMHNPPPHIVTNLTHLCVEVLEPLRVAVGRPIIVSSGWRPQALNSLIGGSLRSQHIAGQAADFAIPGLTVTEVCKLIVAYKLPFDQLIHEFGAWVHVSYSSTRRRGEVLTAKRMGRQVVYLPGLPA